MTIEVAPPAPELTAEEKRAARAKLRHRDVPSYLIQPPAWMFELHQLPHDAQLVDVHALAARPSHRVVVVPAPPLPLSPSTVPSSSPPPPPTRPPTFVPRAARPLVHGDAVELADLALARGDAFDAVAQLRPLLAAAASDDRPYLELQMARAYVALGRIDEAQELLQRAVDRGTSAAWPAVFELATILVRDRDADAYETWRLLAPRVPHLQKDLAQHLLPFATDDENAARIAAVAPPPLPPPPPPARSPAPAPMVDLTTPCLDALATYEAGPPNSLPGWRLCPVPALPAARFARSATETEQLQAIASKVRTWNHLLYERTHDEDSWLLLAHRAVEIVDHDPTSSAARLASWIALVAYQNAANIAAQRGTPYIVTADYLAFARKHVDRMHADHRKDARRISDSFMQAAP